MLLQKDGLIMLIILMLFIIGIAIFVYGDYVNHMQYGDIETSSIYNGIDEEFYIYIKDKRD